MRISCRRSVATSGCAPWVSIVAVLASLQTAGSSNVLYIMPFGSPSHVNAIVPLLEGLSARGHNVTFLTEYVPTSVLRNPVHVVHLKGLDDIYEKNRPNAFEMMDPWKVHLLVEEIVLLTNQFCEGLVSHPVFQDFARVGSTPHFDVVIMDNLMSECALSLLPRLGSPPLIYYCTTTLYEFTAYALNIPTPYAYVPTLMMPSFEPMTLSQRAANAFFHVAYQVLRDWYIYPRQQAIVRRHFPDTPPLHELERNVSLVLTNSHMHSLDIVRPTAPFLIEVGGTHCRPAKALPKDIDEFLRASGNNGFIFFSLGSNVQSNELPQEKIDAFLGAFRRLKQNVLWKFESELPNLPLNVQIRKWVSQQDVLGHSNIQLFISHGGQLSTQEAIFHSVPVLGFPVFGDQLINIGKGVSRGFAKLLEYDGLSEQTVYEAITEMLNNASYRERAKYYSTLMKDRPVDSLATAIFWVEYVIRHKGSHHLHFNAAKELNFFQYFLLDILALIVLVFSIVILSFVCLGKFVFRKFFQKFTVVGRQKKQN